MVELEGLTAGVVLVFVMVVVAACCKASTLLPSVEVPTLPAIEMKPAGWGDTLLSRKRRPVAAMAAALFGGFGGGENAGIVVNKRGRKH